MVNIVGIYFHVYVARYRLHIPVIVIALIP